jgi:hypothetical protein
MLLVFIDVSIYESLNFQTESEPLALLSELSCGGYVTALEHPIAKREIFKRIEKLSSECIGKLLTFRKENYLGRNANTTPFKEIFSEFDQKALETELAKRMSDFLGRIKSEPIPRDSNAVSDVFELYFDNRPPFDVEQKKHEFPDAFVIHDLCKKAETTGQIIHVVSVDGDFERSLCQNNRFVIHKTLESFLREVYGRKIHVKEDALRRVNRSKRKIKKILAEAFLREEISNRDGWIAQEIEIEEVELSKIVEVQFQNWEGKYQVDADFLFKMVAVENFDVRTETGGITQFHQIIDPDNVRLTVPCSFNVRFDNSTNRILKWKPPVLNYGRPISVNF